jgi:PAS domain S-box-containing protein
MLPNDLNFIPIDREINLDPDRTMVCRYSPDGTIEYINDYFVDVSGYEIHEIVGSNIESFKHVELPMTIFKYMMRQAKMEKNVNVLIKEVAKDGRFYWYYTNFEFKKDPDGAILSFIDNRKAAPRMVLPIIESFYEKLLKIEKRSGIQIASGYFDGFNEENGMSFSDYTKALILNSGEILQNFTQIKPVEAAKGLENKSFFSKIFKE